MKISEEKLKQIENKKFDLDEIRSFIRETSMQTAIYVGCDSKKFIRKGVRMIAYVVVVVVHYEGNKGAKIFKQISVDRDHGQLRNRLMNEVYNAANVAYEIADAVGDRPFEVHLDINPNPDHKSSIVVKEATGYVMGMVGFAPKLKPESIASSTAADRYTVTYYQDRRRPRKGAHQRARARNKRRERV